MNRDIIFWQNMPAHIMTGAMRCAAAKWPGNVWGIYDLGIYPERSSLGWQMPDMGSVRVKFLSEEANPHRFVRSFVAKHCHSIHVVAGMSGCLAVNLAWTALMKSRAPHVVVVTERPYTYHRNPLVWRYRKLAIAVRDRYLFSRYGRRIRAFLAMGALGMDEFARHGCPRDLMFPYPYQCDVASTRPPSPTPPAGEPVRFLYLGQFNHRKGVDVLLQALGLLPDRGWTLAFVGGGGDCELRVREIAARMPKQIAYCGTWRSDEVVARLADFDVVIVPSRHDGWGAVVNEALEAGVGTIVSDNAGAAEMIHASGAGTIVRAGDPAALAASMTAVLSDHEIVDRWKQRSMRYSPCIRPEVVGQYLVDVLRFACLDACQSRPKAPWLRPTCDEIGVMRGPKPFGVESL